MAGPKPKPTRLKILEGRKGAKNQLNQEPQPKPMAPKMPRGLSAGAKRYWKKDASTLVKIGLLTEVDGAMFAIFCQARADWEKYNKLCADSATCLTPNNYEVVSPNIVIRNKAEATIRALAPEFGLSPSSRSRLKVNTKNPNRDDLLT